MKTRFSSLDVGDEFVLLDKGKFHLKPFVKVNVAIARDAKGVEWAMGSDAQVNKVGHAKKSSRVVQTDVVYG